MGLVAAILDAILDEAAVQLDSSLAPTPLLSHSSHSQHTHVDQQQFHLQPMNSFSAYLLHGIFTLLGVLIGHRLPRVPVVARTPTRLRVV